MATQPPRRQPETPPACGAPAGAAAAATGATTTTPAKRPKVDLAQAVPVATLRQVFADMGDQLAAALPRTVNLDAKRLVRLALSTVQASSTLRRCSAWSIIRSVMTAAALGLECDGTLGHAYLVPFKTTCTLMIGYKGYIALAMRTGEVAFIDAYVVYERDTWAYEAGDAGFIKHQPARPRPIGKGTAESPEVLVDEPIVAFYSVCQFKSGGKPKTTWMWKEEVDAIRKRSRAANDGPWVTDYVPMGKKTTIRRMSATLGLSAELTRAAGAEGEVELGISDASLVELELPAEITEAQTRERMAALGDKYAGAPEGAGPGEGQGDQPPATSGGPAGAGEGALFDQGGGTRDPGAEG